MDYGVLAGTGAYAVQNLPLIAESIQLRNDAAPYIIDQVMTWQMIISRVWSP